MHKFDKNEQTDKPTSKNTCVQDGSLTYKQQVFTNYKLAVKVTTMTHVNISQLQQDSI